MKGTEFERYAVQKCGISSNAISGYANLTAAYINPTIIEERALNVASMDVFSRLMMDRILVLGTEINNDVANIITAQLLYLTSQNPTADITMYLNTPGGSVSAGLSIMDTMNLISPDVATTVTGMAASMGSILLCSGAKGKRTALPHARVLIHQPLGGASGQASDILIAARQIESCREELCNILSRQSAQSYDKVFADMDRDYWMTSGEALEYGMIDNIMGAGK